MLRVDHEAVVMEVRGDHDTYQVELYRQDPWTFAISQWACSCPWGDWAFKRQVTYVGRFCSHALASLYEVQSLENRKDSPLYRWDEGADFRPYWVTQPEKPPRPKTKRRKRRSRVASHSCSNPLCSGDERLIGADRMGGEDVRRLALILLGPTDHLVVPHGDPHLKIVLSRGDFWGGAARLELGRRNGCHANAARLWEQGRGDIATGYALSPDGYWRQHSWVVAPDGLIETTQERTRYYGAVLTDTEAAGFAAQNQ